MYPDPEEDWPGIVCGWRVYNGRCDLRGRIIRKNRLIKRNVARDKDTTSSKVKTPVALMFLRVTKEDAASSTWLHLVLGCGIKIWKTQTTKSLEVRICGMLTKKKKMRCGMTDGSGGMDI
jgi:hypothetical protein